MSLKINALWLGLAGMVEYGLQLAVSVVLVRYLDAETFGHYRFLWLMASTVFAFAPLYIPQALFYFLPRNQYKQGVVVGNAIVYLVLAGFIVVLITSTLNPYLPKIVTSLAQNTSHFSSIFLGLWVVGSLWDVLPTADGAAQWQAKATVFIAIARSLALVAAAITTHDISTVTAVLVVVAFFKLILTAHYLYQSTSIKNIGFDRRMFVTQFSYAIPFAAGNALFLMRLQADQWMVAFNLSAANYAVFSVASVLAPVATLVRSPVNNAMLPLVNSAYAKGNVREIMALILKTNTITALVLIPLVGGLAVIARELVTVVYTSAYLNAVPAMEIYLVGMMVNAFAVGHLLPALNLGRFEALNNSVCLIFSCLLSYLGLHYIGLPGAALGSVSLLAISEIWSVHKISRLLDTSWTRLIPWRALIPALLSVLVGTVIGHSVGTHLKIEIFWLILFKGATYVLTYCTVFMLSGGYRQVKALVLRTAAPQV